MLSPNATKLVMLMIGTGGWTTTLNEQEAVRCRTSTAVQVTAVEPTGKSAPLVGEHETATFGAPPTAVASPNWTEIGCDLGDVTGGGAAGQLILGPFGYGSVVGVIGLSHPTASVARKDRKREKRKVLLTKLRLFPAYRRLPRLGQREAEDTATRRERDHDDVRPLFDD
jgi:hypothetical protein